MSISLRCPQCGKSLKAAEAMAGRTAGCPRCGTKMAVPPRAPSPQQVASDGPLLPAAAGRKQSSEDLVDMTAMVDIVFFLLIFFLVTSMQGVCASLGLPTPDPQSPATAPRTIVEFENDQEFVIVRIDRDNTVWLEDAEVPSQQELLVRLREAREGPSPPQRMLVLGNGDAHHEAVVHVLDAGNAVGIEDIRLAIDEGQEY